MMRNRGASTPAPNRSSPAGGSSRIGATTMQLSLARGWDLDVQRGPDWLYVRPRRQSTETTDLPFSAEKIWSLLGQTFSRRLVLELDEVEVLDSYLIAQLVCLQKRIHTGGGIMRICGLNGHNEEVLHLCRLDTALPMFRNREEAVMGNARP